MPTLSITKAYSAGNILTEAHLDNFRTALLTLINTTKLDVDNFQSGMALTDAKFSDNDLTSTDNSFIKFGADDDGQIGLDASKNLVFKTTTVGCLLEFYAGNTKSMCFDANNMKLYGDVYFGLGNSTYSLLYVLSRYRKPKLVYEATDRIAIENNTGTTNETLVATPNRLIGVTESVSSSSKFRSASIGNTANGYLSSHSGAARGGRRDGLSLTTNTWYPIYAVRVRYGTDAGNNFILVYEDNLPTPTGISALNTRYGTGEWVYLGLVRYGFGASGASSSIIPFVATNKGWTYFYGTDNGTNPVAGLVLYSSTASADNFPAYTLSDGTGTTQVPLDCVARGQIGFYRATDTEFQIRDSSDSVIWGSPTINLATAADLECGAITEVPLTAGMDFCIDQMTSGAVAKRVHLMAFCDRMVALRQHGQGV